MDEFDSLANAYCDYEGIEFDSLGNDFCDYKELKHFCSDEILRRTGLNPEDFE